MAPLKTEKNSMIVTSVTKLTWFKQGKKFAFLLLSEYTIIVGHLTAKKTPACYGQSNTKYFNTNIFPKNVF